MTEDNSSPRDSSVSSPLNERNNNEVPETSIGIELKSQLFDKPLIRRRSSLFESLPPRNRTRGEKSASSFQFKISEQSSTLLESEFQSTLVTSQQSASEHTNSVSTTSQRKMERNPSLFGAVMKRFGATVTTNTTNQMPGTPTRKMPPKTDWTAESLLSPTGKSMGIMNFVNRFVNSPFRFQSPNAKRKMIIKTGKHSRTLPKMTPSPGKKRRRLEMEYEDSRSSLHDNQNWQEVPILEQQMKLVDWSLKHKLRLESDKSIRFILAKHGSLTYWQHPSSTSMSLPKRGEPPLKKGKRKGSLDENDMFSCIESNKEAMLSPGDLATKLTRLVKGDNAFLSQSINSEAPAQTFSSPQHTTIREWQEAFRSIYINFCRKLEHVTEDLASDIYFYCVAKDHSVIFRVDKIEDSLHYTPRVIISNYSHEFREKLESMGVERIEFLDSKGDSANDQSSPIDARKLPPMSPNVKADLEALRRAQAYGENAGADVHVKVQKKLPNKVASSSTGKQPLSILGIDNVSLFFEVYLNQIGQLAPNADIYKNLPLLLCREGLGPFLHAVMKSLRVLPVKSKDCEVCEVEGGVILPCAIRSMIGHLASEIITSKYMVVHTVTDKKAKQQLKLNDSVSFNHWQTGKVGDEQCSEDDSLAYGSFECHNGKTVQLIVWDVSRRNVIACNME